LRLAWVGKTEKKNEKFGPKAAERPRRRFFVGNARRDRGPKGGISAANPRFGRGPGESGETRGGGFSGARSKQGDSRAKLDSREHRRQRPRGSAASKRNTRQPKPRFRHRQLERPVSNGHWGRSASGLPDAKVLGFRGLQKNRPPRGDFWRQKGGRKNILAGRSGPLARGGKKKQKKNWGQAPGTFRSIFRIKGRKPTLWPTGRSGPKEIPDKSRPKGSNLRGEGGPFHWLPGFLPMNRGS